MKIAVCVKLNRGELSPFDASALECALSVPQAEIVAVSMAPPQAKDPLAALTRLGNVRGLLISDGAFAGSDTIATSRVLAAAIARISPDLVLCGRQSTDGDTAQVPPMLAERLGYGFIPYVTRFGLTTADTRLGERQVKLPAVMSVERIAALRRPSIFSRAGETEIVSNAALGLSAELVGQKGSPTRVVQSFSNKNGVRRCEFITAAQLPEAIRAAQKGRKKRERVKRQGEKLGEVCYVGNIGNTAEEIAQRAVPLSGSAEEIAQAVKERGAQVLLFEATLQNRALAPAVAVKLEAGLTADCTLLSVENGKLRMYRPALGGDVIAGIDCVGCPAMATVRAESSNANAMFSVGFGALRSLPEIKEAAARWSAELACSRKLVDGGEMPYENQVGLTGKTVSPNVYVAFGISGAVQHVCAIENADTVIAVNKDKNAPIFSYADFGVIEEVENVKL